MDWKRRGFESGGAGERSFSRKKTRPVCREILTAEDFRLSVLESLTRDNIEYTILEDGAIEADFRGGIIKRLTPAQIKDDFARWKKRQEERA
jgi:hypothetical protein